MIRTRWRPTRLLSVTGTRNVEPFFRRRSFLPRSNGLRLPLTSTRTERIASRPRGSRNLTVSLREPLHATPTSVVGAERDGAAAVAAVGADAVGAAPPPDGSLTSSVSWYA